MNKVFLDTNILIYLYASDELKKTAKVQELLTEFEDISISTQVLFEFSYISQRKLKRTYTDIEKALKEFHKAFNITLITYQMLLHALKVASNYKYSFPDSLIISAALSSDCDILFSEDMHNNQLIEDNLKIINPFLKD